MTSSALEPFLELRRTIVAEAVGDGGRDVCRVLTEALDRGIAELAADLPRGIAVAAVGGYGRGEQCLFSDVDILVLHTGLDPDVAVRAVLYPLWDANLKVGHAVRTLEESATACREDFTTLTALLSSRLIGGDGALHDDLIHVMIDLVRGRPLAPRLADLERERRLREPYQLMAADLKDGRGGLRTHQGLWWERRRAELLGLSVDEATDGEVAARAALLSVRNALHATSGRATDRFVAGLREPAAAWLDTDVYGIAAMVTSALDTGDRIADRRWPDIHVETDPMVKFGRRIFGPLRSRFSTEKTGAEDASGSQSALSIAVSAAGRPGGARLTTAEEATIREADPIRWTAADRLAFELLLSAGARGRSIFGQLDTLGWIDRAFPEWRAVASAPQLAPFHDHPVGSHLHRTVAEMLELIDGNSETAEIATDVSSSEELILAAFLHDIGKARGGDHANVGAGLASSFLKRSGFGPATVASISEAVRLHLLLPETATRRDIADPAVIDEVADAVGTARQLKILYLVAIADLRATGTTMWNPWRASLLHTLYVRVLDALETGEASPATPDVGTVMLAAGEDVDRRSIEEHVAAMPGDYLDTTTPLDVLWHLGVAGGVGDSAAVVVDPDDPGRVLVVGADRAGFLLAVSRAFAANGVGVLDARLRTRSDGVAIDTFHVVEDRNNEIIPIDRWSKVEDDLNASLAGSADLRPKVQERVTAYRRPGAVSKPRVNARVDGRHTVIEVRMSDGMGVFTAIVEALHGEGLDIHLARIDTMGGDVRDVFIVRKVGGGGIRTAPELAAVEKRLEDRLS